MGEDSGSRQQCWLGQLPNLNCTSFVPVPGMQNAFPAYTNLYNPRMASVDESPTGFTVMKSSQLKMGQVDEANKPHGWFYCLPRQRQALTPIPKVPAKGPVPISHGCNKDITPDVVPRPVEKRFLVFDQCGNQTNLIFSSFNGCSIQHPRFGASEAYNGIPVEEPRIRKVPINQAEPIISYGLSNNHNSDEKSEMHEDTEELNALLYSSEDEDDSFDEEISSTGHSPSKVEANAGQEEVNGSAEEVASSGGLTKRKRSRDEDYTSSSLMDTASSGKSYECEDDAESSCGEGRTTSAVNKRLKRDKIRETINILQNIIPGGKGKDAMLVLDEAIQYLKSLKLKAKSLGDEAITY